MFDLLMFPKLTNASAVKLALGSPPPTRLGRLNAGKPAGKPARGMHRRIREPPTSQVFSKEAKVDKGIESC